MPAAWELLVTEARIVISKPEVQAGAAAAAAKDRGDKEMIKNGSST